MPCIRQCFLKRPASIAAGQEFDRRLYILRRTFEKQDTDTYICSLFCRTIVYKGMMLVNQLRSFYDDLQDVRFCSQMAMVHSRFSTNTFPSWSKAHPQPSPPSIGVHRLRTGPAAEEHLYTPETIHLLQQAVWTFSRALFDRYTERVENEGPAPSAPCSPSAMRPAGRFPWSRWRANGRSCGVSARAQ